ncbi:MAG: phosphoadenylyl-sulfate reductase [Acidobacteriota bacterium]
MRLTDLTANLERVARWQQRLSGSAAEDILRWAASEFPGRIALASSLGLEDQVLTDMLARAALGIRVFTLDTGRLFPETYELMERTRARYGLDIRVMFPESAAVEEMVNRHGVNLFLEGIELRKKCCRVRKLEPLWRALEGLDAWVTGLRREQSVTRSRVEAIEWDQTNGLVKINPLADWPEARVWAYIQDHKVPYNPLHDCGFPSIGCSGCTRAVRPGEDPRSGRWWWERPEHRECGLHRPVAFSKPESEVHQ